MTTEEPVLPKPSWRGRIHLVAFLVSIPAGVALVLLSRGVSAHVGAAIFAASLIGLFGVSAIYHTGDWAPHVRARLRRMDHAMIFVLIAGTYTPLALVVLRPPWSVVVLSVVWGGALIGAAIQLFHIDGLRPLTSAMYVTLGWLAVLIVPRLARAMSPTALILLFAGGLLYTGGAIVLARNRPNPIPAVFGYHEIWHACVVGASACHYSTILLVTHAAR
jgi:hemolysin III